MKDTAGAEIEWGSAWDMLEKKKTELDDAHTKIRNLENDLNEAIRDKYEWKSVAEGDLLGALDKLSDADRKIEQQAHRIRFLECAINHVEGTPLRKMKEQRDALISAAQAVIDSWEVPFFANTGRHINALKKAIEWMKGERP